MWVPDTSSARSRWVWLPRGVVAPAVPTAALAVCSPTSTDKACTGLGHLLGLFTCISSCHHLQRVSSLYGRRKPSTLLPWEPKAVSVPPSSSLFILPLRDGQRRLQKVPDLLCFGDLSFQLLFSQLASPSACVLPCARLFLPRELLGTCALAWVIVMCSMAGWGIPTPPDSTSRVPGELWYCPGVAGYSAASFCPFPEGCSQEFIPSCLNRHHLLLGCGGSAQDGRCSEQGMTRRAADDN